MKILLLSAYDGPSHRYWREGLVANCCAHQWVQLALPGRYFSWRIRGNPLSWINSDLDILSQTYDLLIATSMVDLATLKGLVPSLATTPSIYYFHENQFEYPRSNQQQHSIDPQMVNLYAALSADRLVFNSTFNRDSFVKGVDALLKRLPDHRPKQLSSQLLSKSSVIPVPLSTNVCDNWDRKQEEYHWKVDRNKPLEKPLRLIWSGRWEYDKGPDRLLAILRLLEARGIDFRIAILGENFRNTPVEFEIIAREFPHRIVQFGYVEEKQLYFQWLSSADIILSTAIHEFQGLAVLEGILAGCVPVLPDRLVYPELVATAFLYQSHSEYLDKEARSAVDLIESTAQKLQRALIAAPNVEKYLWHFLNEKYEQQFAAAIEQMR